MEKLWIQYAYDDPDDAPIIQTADSEGEAREENRTVMDNCCWYIYDVTEDGVLINPDGPHFF